ncbi:MAG: PAS domain S-box protein, partial [Sedimentibacter sp.]
MNAKTADSVEMSEKLKESESLFRTIFEQAPIGISIGNNDNYITKNNILPNVNPMFEKIVGRTKKEFNSVSWTDITHPDDLSADLENFLKFKTGVVDSYSLEKRYIKPDGSDVWVNMTMVPLKINNNSDYNHLCTIEDISQRKYIEKVLYESERSKSVLLSNIPGMAYRCNYDKDWTIQFVSEGCYALTGYKSENLLYNKDLSFNDLIVAEYRDKLWNEWSYILSIKTPFRYEYEIITADGNRKWVLEIGQGVYDTNGNVEALEGIIIDITEQKEREYHI